MEAHLPEGRELLHGKVRDLLAREAHGRAWPNGEGELAGQIERLLHKAPRVRVQPPGAALALHQRRIARRRLGRRHFVLNSVLDSVLDLVLDCMCGTCEYPC